ncbi:unnamed protein product, partial [Choristocarpus tenellus]
KGASCIYGRLIHPWLVHYEGEIDGRLEGVRSQAGQTMRGIGTTAVSEITRVVTQ